MALTKYNYNSFNVTPVASKALAFNSDADGLTTAAEGSMVLIKTLTADGDGTLEFVNGSDDVVLDSTYSTYIFKFVSIHPQTNDKEFQVAFRDGSTAYDATKTTTTFNANHNEADTATGLTYDTNADISEGTGLEAPEPASK